MAKKWCASLALVLLAPLALQAGGADKPTAVVRFRSLDALVDNVKLLVTLAGREEIAKQVEGLVKAKIGVQGLEGIDPVRPFGAYVRLGKELDDIAGAVLIPIANEKAFIGLLENLNLKATKGKNDIYTIPTGQPIEAYLRFGNGYAYVTALNTKAIEGKLTDPVEVLGKDGPTFAAAIRLDQLPEAARQIAIAQAEEKLQALANQKLPGETAGQQAVRTAAVKEITKNVIAVLKDGGEFSLALDLNSKSKELSASVSFSGKTGSELEQTIQKLGQGKSIFGSWRGADAAVRGAAHVVLPDDVKKSLNKLLDEGAADVLGKLQDAGKRQQAQQLLNVLLPTLKAGELDACVQLMGPGADQKYALVLGVKVNNGVKMGNTLHDLVAEAMKQMPAAERAKIQLNHTTVGAVKIHRLELPSDQKEVRELQKVLGEANVHFAFREDAVFVALGKDSLAALKQVVVNPAAGPSPLLSFEVDVGRLAALIAPTEELRASAKKIFANGQDGMVRLSLEGGAALRFRVTTRLAVVQFLSQTREMKTGN